MCRATIDERATTTTTKRRINGAVATKHHNTTTKQLIMSDDDEDRLNTTTTNDASSSLYYKFQQVLFGALLGCLTLIFSKWFPYFLAPYAAKHTYDIASYHYIEGITFFDNTIWTYGTDYVLGVIMLFIAYKIYSSSSSRQSQKLRIRGAGLLLCYTISVLAGGYSHQYFLTIESRNTIEFRILWTICVGTVTAASGFMGCCGTQLVIQFCSSHQKNTSKENILQKLIPTLPILSEFVWIGFGTFLTLVCVLGGISYQRPACDIFIAGTQQFPPTFYIMLSMIKFCSSSSETSNLLSKHSTLKYRIMCFIGFIGNAPLLPMYPLLVQYTDWSLSSINTLLHFWLFVSWSQQGLSLKYFCSLIKDNDDSSSSDVDDRNNNTIINDNNKNKHE